MKEKRSEKELLQKSVEFLEELGKKCVNLPSTEERKLLQRYGIGSIESLRIFWKFKKQQLDNLKIKSKIEGD